MSIQNSVLLFGGESEERMVSVASAQNLVEQYEFSELLYQANDERVYNVSKTEILQHQNVFKTEFNATSNDPIANSLQELVKHLNNKVVFLGLHGSEGENGEVQKLFEDHKISFTGSGSLSSSSAFLKDRAKSILKNTNIKLSESFKINLKEWPVDKIKLEIFLSQYKKIVLKPVASGSSFGLHIVDSTEKMNEALTQMLDSQFDQYLVENFISGRELTVAVLMVDGMLKAMPASEVVLSDGRSFDYDGKYLGTGTQEHTPAKITKEQLLKAQTLALQAHQMLECYGYSRTDMILSGAEFYFLETNTLPGLSKPSFVPQQLTVAGIEMSLFIDQQLKLAQYRYS